MVVIDGSALVVAVADTTRDGRDDGCGWHAVVDGAGTLSPRPIPAGHIG
jgi:hypothetical protein